jgi:hypothetical protein
MDELEEELYREVNRIELAINSFNAARPRRWMAKHGGLMCGPLRSSEYRKAAKRYREIRQKAVELLKSTDLSSNGTNLSNG